MRGFPLLWRIKTIGGQQQPFNGGLRGLGHIQPADPRAVDDSSHMLSVEVPGAFDGRRRRSPNPLQIKSVRFTQSHHQHATGGDRPTRINHGNLSRLALQIATGDQITDRTPQRLINCASGPTRNSHAFK